MAVLSGAILGGRWDVHRLDRAEWDRRHLVVLRVLALHLPFLVAVALVRGVGALHVAGELLPVAVFTAVAAYPRVSWRWRSLAAVMGLLSCSAMLVHLTEGLAESQFHFFAVVAFLAVYRDLSTTVISVIYVVVHHAVLGSIEPSWVFSTPEAQRRPWLWAIIHGGYVLALGLGLAYLHLRNEAVHERAEDLAAQIAHEDERRRSALEINDNVVQGLAVAKYALELGDRDLSERAIMQTLESARGLISDLLGKDGLGTASEGSLVRAQPALVITRPPDVAPTSQPDEHMDVA